MLEDRQNATEIPRSECNLYAESRKWGIRECQQDHLIDMALDPLIPAM